MLEPVKNSESPEKVGYTDYLEEYGGHWPLTTSGITTTVPKLSAEIWDMELVLELEPEIHTTDLTSILLVTEDAMLVLEDSLIAESTVDQTTMTEALKLMLDAQVNHTWDQTSEEEVLNSQSMEDHPDTSGEKPVMENGDHLLLTTSGITTTVPKSFAETCDSVLVLEPIPEDNRTKNNSTLKLETEDVLPIMITSFNAEDTVDQTKET